MTDAPPTVPLAAHASPHRGARRAAHPGLILLLIAGAQLMVVLDGTIVNIALPHMADYFHRNQTDMTWALNAYTLAFGGLLLLGGRSGDILGRRRMFIVGLSLFTIGSFLGGISVSFGMLLFGRAVQGIGGAIAAPTALSLITNEFEEGPARNRAFAVYAAVSGAGAALGLLLGGILTNYLDWRWVLFVNVPIGIVLITGAFLYLHQTERLKGRFDIPGALLSVAGMVSLVYGFIHVAHDGWGNTETFVVFAAAIILLVAFGLYEAFVAPEPMLPMRIFENRSRSGAYLVMLIVGAAMFGMFYFITFFIQLVRDYSALKAGFAFLPVAFIIGIVSQIMAKLLPRTGPRPLVITGTVFLTGALLWLSTVAATSGYWDTLLPGMVVLGIAMGCLFVPLTTVAVSRIASTDAGLASALLNVGQQVGGSVGLSVLATVFATSAKNFASSHAPSLAASMHQLPPGLAAKVGPFVQHAGSNGLQPEQINSFVKSLPPSQQAAASNFFAGPYRDFSHQLLAHASAHGFFAAAMFGAVSIVVAVLMIRVKRSELPTGAAEPEVAIAA